MAWLVPQVFPVYFFAFVIISENSFSSGSIEINPFHLSSIVKFRLFFLPFLFSLILSCFTKFRQYFWPFMIWPGSGLNLCQSLSGPHVSFWNFSFKRVNFVISKNLKNACANRQTIIVNPLFLHQLQICMGRLCNITVFQWSGKCSFLQHKELIELENHCDDDR